MIDTRYRVQTDLTKAVMESQNSRYGVIVLSLTIVTAGLTVVFPFTCLNPAVPVLKKMFNQTYFRKNDKYMPDSTWTAVLSLTMSMLFVGAFVGALLLKLFLSRLTRKQMMIIIHVTSILGHVIIALGGSIWGSYEAFIIGRFVTGFGIGLGLGLFPVVVNEICAPQKRPLFGGLLGSAYMFGALCGVFFGWSKVFGSDDRWLGIPLFGMLPSLVYLACVYWITDTPFQAKMKSGPAEALIVLKKLRTGQETAFEAELQSLGGGSETGSAEATLKEVFKTPQYRKHFIGMVILFSGLSTCGISNILFFSDTILANAGLDSEATNPANIGVYAIGPLVSIAGIFFLRHVEPRVLIIAGNVIMILGDAFLTASIATYKTVPAMSIFSVVAMCIFFFGFTLVNLTAYVIMAVISTDRTQSLGINVGAMGFWFFSWLVGFISPYFEEWIGPYAFLVWMVVTIGSTIYIIFCVPNTRGKTEQEIQDFYKGKTK